MTHTDFAFQEVPDGGDIVASCQECPYEIMHVFETGRVQILNFGDLNQAHQVVYMPNDGLRLEIGIGGSKDDPPGGDEPPAPILPVKPRGVTGEASRRAEDTCTHGKPSGPGGT